MDRRFFRIAVFFLLTGILALGFVLIWTSYHTSRSIHELLDDNRELCKDIRNLTEQHRVGYVKVLEQRQVDGRLNTRLIFVITDPEDPTRQVLKKEYELEGDVVYSDALIVRFGKKLVMDGKEHALYLWRRVDGETMRPDQRFESISTERLLNGTGLLRKDLIWGSMKRFGKAFGI